MQKYRTSEIHSRRFGPMNAQYTPLYIGHGVPVEKCLQSRCARQHMSHKLILRLCTTLLSRVPKQGLTRPVLHHQHRVQTRIKLCRTSRTPGVREARVPIMFSLLSRHRVRAVDAVTEIPQLPQTVVWISFRRPAWDTPGNPEPCLP